MPSKLILYIPCIRCNDDGEIVVSHGNGDAVMVTCPNCNGTKEVYFGRVEEVEIE